MRKNIYPSLDKSYKGVFPFRIGTTSYIYPDGYVPNIRMLAPFFDEIELLIFESDYSKWPSISDIRELLQISMSENLGYNIHLPLDIHLGASSQIIRQRAQETIIRLMDRITPLNATTHTLHLVLDENLSGQLKISQWRHRILDSLISMEKNGVGGDDFSIETLDYPLKWVMSAVDALDMTICLDVGHLYVNGHDPMNLFHLFQKKISIMHLYGFRKKHEHKSLKLLNNEQLNTVCHLLKTFKKTVSLEVFSFNDLKTSLQTLEILWEKRLNPNCITHTS
jgi:sugar phosphate isomerase/epimerase